MKHIYIYILEVYIYTPIYYFFRSYFGGNAFFSGSRARCRRGSKTGSEAV